ncbi:MAG: alpha-glucan family phosphorylase [candidate division KSB1 bacterium]|nr:alpha-glucan family phosphorylase [candidate division KSB1 bacterium]
MEPIKTFTIAPSLPPKLAALKKIAYNLFWSWNHDAIDLFRLLDADLWEAADHNPVKMLGQIRQERLEKMADDEGFLSHLQRVADRLDSYLKEVTWYRKTYCCQEDIKIAYFSAEFGLTECVPIYSGGLGVLAGDYLKSASELGLPLVGVGLLYQEGYFRQYLNADGWQGELYPKNDFYNMPIELQHQADGSPLLIDVDYPGRKVFAQIWKVHVGRVALYLLDTNIPQNNDADKDITDELYGGDDEMRIMQEIMLGIGGVRALKALGLKPVVFHMNEGHSAFLALERIRCAMEDHQLGFEEARELTKASNIFTTHTPVPAGIDRFSPQLIDKYFSNYYPLLKINRQEFLSLGTRNPADPNDNFTMAILAIRLAGHINAVSKLHQQTSKEMWQDLWPQVPTEEVPITYVDNGMHPSSWISRDMATLFDRYLGPNWMKKPVDVTIWKKVEQIPAEELWRTHIRRRERLVAFTRDRLRKQLENQGAVPSEVARADEVLNPEALTIGFARRFATYKRATLILKDKARLSRILNNEDFPVQIIYAGKAHPKDNPGKELIREIIHLTKMEEFRNRIVFIEDYDMVSSRYLVQGVDLWLNTPRRFMEASGTSGMKAAVNGVLNLSILDGWWDAAYNPRIGWAIGRGEAYEDHNYQDNVESQAIYNLLEKEIIPLFYDRGKNGLPRKWIEVMKSSMAEICPVFNTNRMAHEYHQQFYLPAMTKFDLLFADEQQKAKQLTLWKHTVAKNWQKIRFVSIDEKKPIEHQVGAAIEVQVKIALGTLTPNDVSVQIYHGYVDEDNEIINARIEPMNWVEKHRDNIHSFSGKISCQSSGLYGYTVRVIPQNELLSTPHETGLIFWAGK